ncbi:MAG TPA: c-type cytochrome [Pyrinomonadaceae bacterium]|nr:c-type cytochrome [Pyrinomonadaceae bacterium]HMP65033.1 c-type cytochrome [Pyrinomonadaceae bacterium]
MDLLRSFTVLIFVSIVFAACAHRATNTGVAGGESRNVSSTPSTSPTPLPEIAIPLEAGKTMFKVNCAQCHKESGIGGEVEIQGKKLSPADLTGEKVRKMSDEDILQTAIEGKADKGMPSFKEKLHPEAIELVIEYIREVLQKQPANTGTDTR